MKNGWGPGVLYKIKPGYGEEKQSGDLVEGKSGAE